MFWILIIFTWADPANGGASQPFGIPGFQTQEACQAAGVKTETTYENWSRRDDYFLFVCVASGLKPE